jgi:LysM repeat protein
MAKLDITKRPRRTMDADERNELFREFKLGLVAMVILVALVVTLCWGRGEVSGGTEAKEPGSDASARLVRVVIDSGSTGGGSPSPDLQLKAGNGKVDGDSQQKPAPQDSPPPDTRIDDEAAPVRRRLPKTAPRLLPRYRNYVVRRNDTLWRIARREFGDGRLWKRIKKVNPKIGRRNRLVPGMILVIPNRMSSNTSESSVDSRIASGGGSGRGLVLEARR